MPNCIQRLYTNPEMYRRICPKLLLLWLKRSEGYFSTRGLVLPADPGGFERTLDQPGFDYDGLVRVFMEPTSDMPGELVESLHLVHEMGRPAHVDGMLEEADKLGLELDLGSEATPEDLALKLLLLDARALENVCNCSVIKRRRSFEYFTTDVVPVPRFDGPTLEQTRAIERRLEAFYVAWRRGSGARVFAYCQQRIGQDWPEWFFLVWHGGLPRREEVVEDGQPRSLLFRPRRYALLKYDTVRGEMGVYCSAEQERRVLLRIFGRELFGRNAFFPLKAKFDLRPLVHKGRLALAWADVPPIEEVRLTEVEFFRRRTPWHRVVQQADDLFDLFERGQIRWPKDMSEVTRATFTVKLWRQKRPRRLTIVPCNRALYARDEDGPILAKWMEAREMVRPVTILQE